MLCLCAHRVSAVHLGFPQLHGRAFVLQKGEGISGEI